MRQFNPLKKFKNLGNVTVGYGDKTEQEQFHPGIDIANEQGTPIPAFADGVVTKTDGGHVQGENNFGNTVEIKDSQGSTHQYHHLQNINVSPGERVRQGQAVATMGNSGATYSSGGQGDGTNLDFRIVSAFGKYKHPLIYLKNL